MSKRTIIILVSILVVGFIAYQSLSGTPSNNSSSLVADTQSANSSDAQYIYSLLQQMQQVKLEDKIFANPVFQSLRDNTVTFSPQASGRPNPFAPIGVDTQATGSSAFNPSSSTTIKLH